MHHRQDGLVRSAKVRQTILSLVVPGDPVPKGRPRFLKGGGRYPDPVSARAEKAMAWALRFAWAHPEPEAEALFQVSLIFFVGPHQRPLPDVDNLTKLVLDAGQKVIWKNDKQVVACRSVRIDRAQFPQTRIRVWLVDDVWLESWRSCTRSDYMVSADTFEDPIL